MITSFSVCVLGGRELMSSSLSPQLVLVYNSLASVGVGSLPGSLHFRLVFVYTEAWLWSELESTLSITALALVCGVRFLCNHSVVSPFSLSDRLYQTTNVIFFYGVLVLYLQRNS